MPIAISGRAAGRGGADTAIADDAMGVFLNPAGMGNIPKFRADLQDQLVFVRERYVNDHNDSQDNHTSYLVPAAGVVFDPHWGDEAETPIRVGFGAAGIAGAGGDKRVYSSIFPEGETESLDFALSRIGPAFEMEPMPRLRVGAGVYYNWLPFGAQSAATSSGGNANGGVHIFRNPDGSLNNPPKDFLVNGRPVTWGDIFNLTSSPDSNSSALFKLDSSSAHGINANLGFQYDVEPWLTVGASYTSPTLFFNKLKGKAHIDGSRALATIQANPQVQGLLGPVLNAYLPDGQNANFISEYDYEVATVKTPMVPSVGVAFFPADWAALALDVRWIQWSATFTSIKVKLTNGTNRNINELNGGDSITANVPLDWSDQWVVGLGGTAVATDWLVLRLGYNFATDPLPKDEIGPGAVAYIEHHLTGGASFRIYDGFSATLAAVYGIRSTETVGQHKTTPAYSNASLAAEQLFIYLGVSLDL
jgi:long-subunit fatty acid transport protein